MPSRMANYSDRQAGTEKTQLTAKEEKGRAESGVGELSSSSSLLFYSLWGKDMFRKPSFRWLNIQIAAPPNGPSVPSIVSSLAGYVKGWGHAALIQAALRGLIPGSSTPNALSVRPAFDVLVTWRTRGYQLAVNSVTILHRSQGQQRQLSQCSHPWPSGSTADWPD